MSFVSPSQAKQIQNWVRNKMSKNPWLFSGSQRTPFASRFQETVFNLFGVRLDALHLIEGIDDDATLAGWLVSDCAFPVRPDCLLHYCDGKVYEHSNMDRYFKNIVLDFYTCGVDMELVKKSGKIPFLLKLEGYYPRLEPLIRKSFPWLKTSRSEVLNTGVDEMLIKVGKILSEVRGGYEGFELVIWKDVEVGQKFHSSPGSEAFIKVSPSKVKDQETGELLTVGEILYRDPPHPLVCWVPENQSREDILKDPVDESSKPSQGTVRVQWCNVSTGDSFLFLNTDTTFIKTGDQEYVNTENGRAFRNRFILPDQEVRVLPGTGRREVTNNQVDESDPLDKINSFLQESSEDPVPQPGPITSRQRRRVEGLVKVAERLGLDNPVGRAVAAVKRSFSPGNGFIAHCADYFYNPQEYLIRQRKTNGNSSRNLTDEDADIRTMDFLNNSGSTQHSQNIGDIPATEAVLKGIRPSTAEKWRRQYEANVDLSAIWVPAHREDVLDGPVDESSQFERLTFDELDPGEAFQYEDDPSSPVEMLRGQKIDDDYFYQINGKKRKRLCIHEQDIIWVFVPKSASREGIVNGPVDEAVIGQVKFEDLKVGDRIVAYNLVQQDFQEAEVLNLLRGGTVEVRFLDGDECSLGMGSISNRLSDRSQITNRQVDEGSNQWTKVQWVHVPDGAEYRRHPQGMTFIRDTADSCHLKSSGKFFTAPLDRELVWMDGVGDRANIVNGRVDESTSEDPADWVEKKWADIKTGDVFKITLNYLPFVKRTEISYHRLADGHPFLHMNMDPDGMYLVPSDAARARVLDNKVDESSNDWIEVPWRSVEVGGLFKKNPNGPVLVKEDDHYGQFQRQPFPAASQVASVAQETVWVKSAHRKEVMDSPVDESAARSKEVSSKQLL
jgi:hypothetical protein